VNIPALSVKQPWASLLVAGVKRFEVRTWPPSKLGFILIHASSGKASGIRELRAEPLFQEALQRATLSDEKSWQQSAFVGLAEIIRVIEPDDDFPHDVTELDRFLGSGEGCFLWEVGRSWPFPTPVPSHGKLNLWSVPKELFSALNAQLQLVRAGIQLSPNT